MGAAWVIAEPWSGRGRLAAALGVCPIVAQILHNRGLDDPGAARRFLRPQLSELEGPEALPGAVEAAGRLARAVREGRRIVIYGDYDVDGIAGTAILWRCLRLAGGQVDFYVPHRLEEGYGLNSEAIEKLADEQVQVVVTVDCGITAVGAAELARRRGVELIITDHHEAGPDLPQGCTIVHPTALSGGYGNADLSGAGVALKLAWVVGQHFSAGKRVSEEFREFLVDATSLAGLGTIADVVPLVGENRVLAHFGLMGLRHCRQEGLRALIAESGLAGRKLESYHVGFWLGPRLNAAGRMGHARLAVELLTRASGARAREIARFLAEQNRQRQQVERRILAEARQMVAETGMDGDAWRAIVLARAGWHAGVIGIVASRLVEQYCRPVVLIAVDGGEGQGSARSVANFAMHEALRRCEKHLLAFGGHAMAAGLRIRADRIEAFREAFCGYAGRVLTGADLRPRLRLDGQVELGELSEAVVEQISRLGPFGVGNPRPRLASGWLRLVGEPRRVGQAGQHLQFAVQDGSGTLRAIGFGAGGFAEALADYRRCRLAFEPIINEFDGRRNVELQVVDVEFPQ